MAAVPPAAMVPGAAVGDGWCTWSEGSGAGEKTAAIASRDSPCHEWRRPTNPSATLLPRVELETFGGRLPPYISMICSLIDSTDACSTLKAVYHGSSLLGPQRGSALSPCWTYCAASETAAAAIARGAKPRTTTADLSESLVKFQATCASSRVPWMLLTYASSGLRGRREEGLEEEEGNGGAGRERAALRARREHAGDGGCGAATRREEGGRGGRRGRRRDD